MRWTLQRQLGWAFGTLSLVAVALASLVLAVVAIDREDRERVRQLKGLAATLSSATYPLQKPVLTQLQGMTGGDFVALTQNNRVSAATLEISPEEAQTLVQQAIPLDQVQRAAALPLFERQGTAWRIAAIPMSPSSQTATLLVLDPERPRREALSDAAFWPVMIGFVLGAGAVFSATVLARRFSQRIQAVQEHVDQLGRRDYSRHSPLGPDDELHRLHETVNQLALRLAELEEEIRRTEQMRILSRLAAGLAHQIRNGLTGARIAIQLHQRRNTDRPDEALDVALRQLATTELQIKSLVSVALGESPQPDPGDLRQIVEDVRSLTQPALSHQKADCEWQCDFPPGLWSVADSDALRTALLNLVTNAIEAVGAGGKLRCEISVDQTTSTGSVRICDNGPGIPPEISARLFNPLVTSKPEGIGLGLAYARDRIISLGGNLDWTRVDGWTCFVFSIPCQKVSPSKSV